MATIAIGDIHGHLKPLCDLLERVRPNVAPDSTAKKTFNESRSNALRTGEPAPPAAK